MVLGEDRKNSRWGRRLGRAFVAGVAAFGLWAVIVNREVINWVDGETKRLGIVSLALLLAAVATVPLWRRWRGPWTRAALIVILGLALGETRRAWLRYQYAVEIAGGPTIELFRPVTTTDLTLRHFDVALPGLTLPRLRVLHVTDLHVTEELPAEYYTRVQRLILTQNPDLLVFTGDYVSRSWRLPLLEEWLAGVPRARLGNYAVLGNHDHWIDSGRGISQAFVRAGVTLLGGACTTVPAPGSPGLRLCGTEAPWGPGLDADAIAQGAPGTSPLFVLSHTPDNVYPLNELGASVVFAGHTHGGQIRVPVLGSIIVPSIYGRRFDLGHFNVEGTHLYVSAGVGADHPPLRIYCPPEIVEVDFRNAP
jgi:predicted MPP superfamily phosphohydrolase